MANPTITPNTDTPGPGDTVTRVQIVSADGTEVLEPTGGGTVDGDVGITGTVTVDETARQTEAVTLLASAARTADPTIAEQTNEYADGVIVSLKVTSAGTGSITFKLVGYHNVDNSTFDLTTATTAITANGTYTVVLAPSAASAATTSTSTPGYLPRRWSVVITHGNANSMTYGLACLLVGI